MTDPLNIICCFCGRLIESTMADPCCIGLTTHWDKPEEDQLAQSLYCHLECFRKASVVTVYFDENGD
jgi:hypothetical protein